MIIRRKMPRLLSRRPIGITGLRALRQSSNHVRRMVVSQIPASISNAPTADGRSEPSPDYASFDTPLVSPSAADAQSRMPKDLQAIYDMHKALGRVQTPKKSLRERIAERKAGEPQPAPPPSARIQKRPDNVRYEPDRIQRSPDVPNFVESDIEPLPEMPPPKSNRVRSFVEYVNFSDGVPESRRSDENDADDSDDSEADKPSSFTDSNVEDWPDDDFPDAMPGSYTFGDVESSSSQDHVTIDSRIQRHIDDEHPTLVDIPLELLQSSSDSSQPQTIQRAFDPIETSNEDLLPPSHHHAPRADSQHDESNDDEVYTQTVIDNVDSGSEITSSPPIQRSFVPIETNDEELHPPHRNDTPHTESQQDRSPDGETYTQTVIDNADSGSEITSSPPVQRSFAPIETSEEELRPLRRNDTPHIESQQERFLDDDGDNDEAYTQTMVENGSDVSANPPVQRSFAPLDISDENLSPPQYFEEFSDVDDNDDFYTETVIDGGSRDTNSHPPVQRSFAPVETSNDELLPPSPSIDHLPESSHGNVIGESKYRGQSRNDVTQRPQPIQRDFEPSETNTDDLLPPASYSGDTKPNPPTSPVQRSVDDEWEETSSLMDIDESPFENPVIPQHEFNSVETSTEDLYPPSYQHSDRSDRGTEKPEQSTGTGHSQPRRMTVSRSESPIVQRFPQTDGESIDSDVGEGQRDNNDTSGLPYQALDLGQALLDAGMAKPKQDTPSQQQSFTVLMPPIGRAHHTASSSAQRTTVEQSIQRAEAPISSQSSSVDAGLLDALGMPPDTVIQRSGPQMPTVSETPSQEITETVQRVVEGTGESDDSGEAVGNESVASPNVEEMAKQVYRILQRRFRIERERSKGR